MQIEHLISFDSSEVTSFRADARGDRWLVQIAFNTDRPSLELLLTEVQWLKLDHAMQVASIRWNAETDARRYEDQIRRLNSRIGELEGRESERLRSFAIKIREIATQLGLEHNSGDNTFELLTAIQGRLEEEADAA